MSFTQSSEGLWLEDGHILHARCQDGNGNWNDSTLDLNKFVGNSDGWFMWDGVNFSHTACNISLDGSMLTAEMSMHNGENRERQGLDLNHRIGNENGQLVYNS